MARHTRLFDSRTSPFRFSNIHSPNVGAFDVRNGAEQAECHNPLPALARG